MFFDSWANIFEIFIVGACAYLGVVLVLRAFGKRTLTKMNAFDFVVTVALGSILASTLLISSVAFADGLAAFVLLALLQFIVTSITQNIPAFEHLIKAEPSLLFHNGDFLEDRLNKERVSKEEVFCAIRQSSISQIDEVEAVVLETDGSLSVLEKSHSGPATTLKNVKGA